MALDPDPAPGLFGARFPSPSRPPPLRLDLPVGESAPESLREPEDANATGHWRTNLLLFVATVISVFWVGAEWTPAPTGGGPGAALSGWTFAVPLLGILVTHEFGHYIAARLHRVPASLPYFLPLPILNPFGTLGAIILMPERIRSRRALLDIGAAGPLAGMALAVPIMILGLSLSTVEPVRAAGYTQEGQSLLYAWLKHLVLGPIPEGYDVTLHPTAFAAWAGFLVTFLNLIPFGQLDGGHVAYALFGTRVNRVARFLPLGVLVLVLYNAWVYTWPLVAYGFEHGFRATPASLRSSAFAPLSWVFVLLLFKLLARASGREHPPVDDTAFDRTRALVAIATLLLFVLVFVPSPLVSF